MWRALGAAAIWAPYISLLGADRDTFQMLTSEGIAGTSANSLLQIVSSRGVLRAGQNDTSSELADVVIPDDETVDASSDYSLTHPASQADNGHSREKHSTWHRINFNRRQQMLRIVKDVENALGLGKDSATSLNPHSPHVGLSPAIPFPYEVRQVADGMMGLFTKKRLAQGAVTWQFNPKDHIAIFEQDLPILRDVLRKKHPMVGLWLTRWTYAWPDYCNDCMLFEMDDSRYTNDGGSSESNEVSDSTGYFMISKKAVPAGSEILDNYEEDGDADELAWWTGFCRTYWLPSEPRQPRQLAD